MTDNALSSNCSLHTAVPSKSSKDLNVGRGLAGISEDVSEAHGGAKLIGSGGDQVLAAEKVSLGHDQDNATRVEATESLKPDDPSRYPGHGRSRTLSNTDKDLPPPLSTSTTREADRTPVKADESEPRPSISSRLSTQSERPTIREMNRSYEYKRKVKLGPRPSIDTGTRSDVSQKGKDSFRPKATLPAGLRMPTRKSASSDPKSPSMPRTPTDTLKSQPSPLFSSVEFVPLMPERPKTAPDRDSILSVQTLEAKPPRMTPEKRRLMKALQIRQKHLEAQNAAKGLGILGLPDRIVRPEAKEAFERSRSTFPHSRLNHEDEQEAQDSPISAAEPSDGPSTQASSINDEEAPNFHNSVPSIEGGGRKLSAQIVAEKSSNLQIIPDRPTKNPSQGETTREARSIQETKENFDDPSTPFDADVIYQSDRVFPEADGIDNPLNESHKSVIYSPQHRQNTAASSNKQESTTLTEGLKSKSDPASNGRIDGISDVSSARQTAFNQNTGQEHRVHEITRPSLNLTPTSNVSDEGNVVGADPGTLTVGSPVKSNDGLTADTSQPSDIAGSQAHKGIAEAGGRLTNGKEVVSSPRNHVNPKSEDVTEPSAPHFVSFSGEQQSLQAFDTDAAPSSTENDPEVRSPKPANNSQYASQIPLLTDAVSKNFIETKHLPTLPKVNDQPQASVTYEDQFLRSIKRFSTVEQTEEQLLSDDSFMEELKSAKVEQAKPISVSKSPIKPVFSRSESDSIANEASITLRSVSGPTDHASENKKGTSPPLRPAPLSMRSFSVAAAPISDPRAIPASQVSQAKKVGVSSGISQRIRALEQISNRPTSPTGSASPTPTFLNFPKPFLSPAGSPDLSNNGRRGSTATTSAMSSPASPKSDPFSRPLQSPSESVTVTATIVREDRSVPPSPRSGFRQVSAHLQQSPLVVQTSIQEEPLNQNMGPPPSPLKPPRPQYSRYSSTQSTSPSSNEQTAEGVQTARRGSFASVRSSSSRNRSEVDLARAANEKPAPSTAPGNAEGKKQSRGSRLLKRMSNVTTISRKSIANAVTPVSKPDLASETPEPALKTLQPEPRSHLDLGDINVQFPDTLVCVEHCISSITHNRLKAD